MSSDPRSTVAVVLHYRREAMTLDCVQALREQEGGAPRIVIVDNDSGDGSVPRLRQQLPDLPLIETGANLGYAGGNNVGIRWALEQGAEFVFVINDDARPGPSCLTKLREALDANTSAALAAPTILHERPSEIIWWAGGRFDRVKAMGVHERYGQRWDIAETAAAPKTVSFVSGCALLMRSSALVPGAFRDDFGAYLEDVELSLRLNRAGWELLHVPAALLEHRVAFPEPPIAPWKIVLRDRNRRRVAREYLASGERVRFWMAFLASRSLRWLEYASRGDWARARAIVQGIRARGSGMNP